MKVVIFRSSLKRFNKKLNFVQPALIYQISQEIDKAIAHIGQRFAAQYSGEPPNYWTNYAPITR